MEKQLIRKVIDSGSEDEVIEFLRRKKRRRMFEDLEGMRLRKVLDSGLEDKIILFLRHVKGKNNNISHTTDIKKHKLMKAYDDYENTYGEDFVFTTPEMAKHLIQRLNFKKATTVLDPCRGDGSFFNNFPNHWIKDYCERKEGIDFFKYELKVDYVIGNPPFTPKKLLWEFHLKAMSVAKKGIYWLLNLNCLQSFTPIRLKLMNEKGWYIQSQHIVQDSRWFGRYTFIQFSKKKNDLYTFSLKKF